MNSLSFKKGIYAFKKRNVYYLFENRVTVGHENNDSPKISAILSAKVLASLLRCGTSWGRIGMNLYVWMVGKTANMLFMTSVLLRLFSHNANTLNMDMSWTSVKRILMM